MSTINRWYDVDGVLESMIITHGSWAAVARATGTSPTTIKDAARRHGISREAVLADHDAGKQANDAPAITIDKSAVEVVIEARESAVQLSLESLAQAYGIDLDSYTVFKNQSLTKHKNGKPYYSLKAVLRPKTTGLLPARTDGPIYRVEQREPSPVEKVLVIGDMHGNWIDREMHESMLRLIIDQQPDRIIINGDIIHGAIINRHDKNPAAECPLNDEMTAVYNVLRSYRDAVPSAQIVVLEGNHDNLLEDHLIKKAPNVREVKRVGEDVPVNTLQYLMRFDELDIIHRRGLGIAYQYSEQWIGQHTLVVHGESGFNTPKKEFEKGTYNVIHGHSHIDYHVTKTLNFADGSSRQIALHGAGIVGQVKEGMGYAGKRPNWQQGCVLVHSYDDLNCDIQHVLYSGDAIYYAGKIY